MTIAIWDKHDMAQIRQDRKVEGAFSRNIISSTTWIFIRSWKRKTRERNKTKLDTYKNWCLKKNYELDDQLKTSKEDLYQTQEQLREINLLH